MPQSQKLREQHQYHMSTFVYTVYIVSRSSDSLNSIINSKAQRNIDKHSLAKEFVQVTIHPLYIPVCLRQNTLTYLCLSFFFFLLPSTHYMTKNTFCYVDYLPIALIYPRNGDRWLVSAHLLLSDWLLLTATTRSTKCSRGARGQTTSSTRACSSIS